MSRSPSKNSDSGREMLYTQWTQDMKSQMKFSEYLFEFAKYMWWYAKLDTSRRLLFAVQQPVAKKRTIDKGPKRSAMKTLLSPVDPVRVASTEHEHAPLNASRRVAEGLGLHYNPPIIRYLGEDNERRVLDASTTDDWTLLPSWFGEGLVLMPKVSVRGVVTSNNIKLYLHLEEMVVLPMRVDGLVSDCGDEDKDHGNGVVAGSAGSASVNEVILESPTWLP